MRYRKPAKYAAGRVGNTISNNQLSILARKDRPLLIDLGEDCFPLRSAPLISDVLRFAMRRCGGDLPSALAELQPPGVVHHACCAASKY